MAGDQELFDKYLNEGHSAAWEQNWDDAIRYYRQALSEFPENYSALTALGLALMENQSYEESLHCYLKATELNPNDAVSIANIARIQERTGKVQEAFENNLRAAELFLKDKLIDQSLENFQHAVSLQPENLNTRIRLATIYDRVGRRKESAEEYLAIASLMQKIGDAPKARQAVNYAVQLVPGMVEAQKALELLDAHEDLPDPLKPKGGTGPMGMAKVVSQESESAEGAKEPVAEAQYQALVKLAGNLFVADEDEDSSGPGGRRGLSALTLTTGMLNADRSAKSRIQLHLSRAIDFQTQGDETKAAAELERAVGIGLRKPEAYFDLGYLLSSTEPDKAATYLQQSVHNPDFALGSYLILAKIHSDQEKLPEATNDYLHALALADSTTVDPLQGDELQQLYIEIIESQQQSDKKFMRTLCTEIEKELMRGDWRDFLMKARTQLPPPLPGGTPIPLVNLLIETRGGRVVESLADIRRLAEQGLYRSAMEEAFYAIPEAPLYLPLHSQMGEVLAREGRIQEAIEKFLLTSRLYDLRGETNQAVQLLSRVSQIAPMDLTVRNKLIEFYRIQGRTNETLQQYSDLGDIYYRMAELDSARQTYLEGLKLAQESKGTREWVIKTLAKVADIDIQRFDWRNAIRMFENLRTLQPEEAAPRLKLIDLNLRLNQNATAISELESYLSFLANTGSEDQAAAFCKSVIDEHPEQYEVRERYGDLLAKAGDQKGAMEQLELALEGFAETQDFQKASRCVQKLSVLNPADTAHYKMILNSIGRF